MLQLILTKEWFDMIESGEKKEEYRELKPFWWKRIFATPHANPTVLPSGFYEGKHDTVRFRLGYAKNAPTMIWKLGRVGIGDTNPKWSGGYFSRMIVLTLQERIS